MSSSVVLKHVDPRFPQPSSPPRKKKNTHIVFVPVHACGKINADYLITHEKCYSANVLKKFSTCL